MAVVSWHRLAEKALGKVPGPVRDSANLATDRLAVNPRDPSMVHKREAGWGRREVYVWDHKFHGTTYRMAWEVIDGDDVVIWLLGPHEGFYGRLGRLARQ